MNRHDRWQHNYGALTQYVLRTGTARVPADHVENYRNTSVLLGNWVSHQRQSNKRGLLSPERVSLLAVLPGWEWGPLKRGPERNDSRDSQILQLCDNGLSLQQIADRVHLSRQRVHQILIRAREAV